MSCFHAKVQMKVMGLQYVSSRDYNAVRLIAYIGSVKVLSEQDMDTLMGDRMLMSNKLFTNIYVFIGIVVFFLLINTPRCCA